MHRLPARCGHRSGKKRASHFTGTLSSGVPTEGEKNHDHEQEAHGQLVLPYAFWQGEHVRSFLVGCRGAQSHVQSATRCSGRLRGGRLTASRFKVLGEGRLPSWPAPKHTPRKQQHSDAMRRDRPYPACHPPCGGDQSRWWRPEPRSPRAPRTAEVC